MTKNEHLLDKFLTAHTMWVRKRSLGGLLVTHVSHPSRHARSILPDIRVKAGSKSSMPKTPPHAAIVQQRGYRRKSLRPSPCPQGRNPVALGVFSPSYVNPEILILLGTLVNYLSICMETKQHLRALLLRTRYPYPT